MKKNNLSLLSELSDFGQRLRREVWYKSNVFTPRLELLALSCIWILLILIANPSGNFPLNDDWSYALAVKTLLEQGQFHLIDWIAATSIAQILWGALFCLPFGFSFMALRASSLLLGLIGVLTTYGLLREIKAPLPVAFLGAIVIATNPIYFELANTFMTDVPFFTTMMLSILMFVRGIRRNRQPEILAGTLFACLAILIRQMGIVIPISFTIACFVLHGARPRNWLPAVYPTLFGILTLLIYQLTEGFSNNYGHVDLRAALEMPFHSLLKAIAVNSFIALSYLGLFLLPFLSLGLPLLWRQLSARGRFLSTVMFAVLFGLLIWQGRSMPFLPPHGNILMKSGLGPVPLRDSYLEVLDLPELPETLWWLLTAGGVIGGGLLLTTIFLLIRQISRLRIMPGFTTSACDLSLVVLLGVPCILYSGPLSITGFYDRYLIPLLPLLMSLVMLVILLIGSPIHGWPVFATLFVLVFYTLFTLGATHDYFSWNRARWDALHYLMGPEMQISSRNIDGGYEFNGWYNYDAHYQASPEKSSWWVENDDYVVVFGPIPGYQVVKRFSYEKWIPFGKGDVFILHRTDSPP